MGADNAIRALRIGLASPEQIRQWSYGEVSRAETINYRTQQPEPDGLFCERIFGPTRDWSCTCGKYQHCRQAGLICEVCGVELAPATVRRERMGHIELAAPVVHPWYVRDRTLGVLLGLTPWQLSALLGSQRYLVLQVNEGERRRALQVEPPGEAREQEVFQWLSTISVGDLLEEDQYRALSRQFPAVVQAETGARAVHERLRTLDLDALAEQLREEVACADQPPKTLLRRLQVVEAFRVSGQRPEWMVLSLLPVLPPELRPLLILDGNRVASADVNELYLRVLQRNLRLKRLLAQGAPELVLHHECRLLQEACNALFDNAHQKKKLRDGRKRPLKSLTDGLQGKGGRFRRNLLGKRVDYSGRSVIVPGPTLLLHECGLPKAMACELFKPFLIGKLLDRSVAASPRAAKRMIERRDALIWDALAEVLFERVVLLNRAPTLHRLSIQAFCPRLVEGQAIQLHPLVCVAFNADFDGDQMAVHVPLTEEAQQEAHRLLLASHNLRHPASGEPSVVPSQEIVLGCFFLTQERAGKDQAKRLFCDPNEAVLAYAAGSIALHSPILVRLGEVALYETPPPAEPRTPKRGRVETTVGRVLFNELLPEALGYRNYPMDKEALKALVAECLRTCGTEATVQLLEQMKRLGYQYATKAGISFASSDVPILPAREALIAQGRERSKEIETRYQQGEISYEEWYRQVVELWTDVTETISGQVQAALDPLGTLMTIVQSGATKAKWPQIRQLCGIRGLLATPSGKIMPYPVLSNYKLGLQVWEIFIAASGARKGFMDRSLNTAPSGYLTRRLVEAGMEVIVTQEDCQTREGLLITHEESRRLGLSTMRSRIIGRMLAEPAGRFAAGTLLDEACVEALLASGVQALRVRSPFCCQAASGICRACYGADLATGALVGLGMAVGVLAGQAIGEPGTQLTMRTFHVGGIAQNAADITLGLPRVNELFEVRNPVAAAPLAERDGILKAIVPDPRTGGSCLHFVSREEGEEWTCLLPWRRPLAVKVGQTVERGTPLVEGPLSPQDLLRLRGREAAARYLIAEVQRVYRGTGAVIHDKHLEVIVRQMLRYVLVVEAGDTELVPGTIIDRFVFLQQVAAMLVQGGRPAHARPILFGVTQTALQTASWIAAASFQDMSRVLTRAATKRQQDGLVGLKERLVIGKKLPMTSLNIVQRK